MRNSITKMFLSLIVVLNLIATANVFGQLPSPWQTINIGNPGQSGTASLSGGTYTINGGGADIWSTSDQFYFAYQNLSGDGEIIAKVTSIQNVSSFPHGAIMIRETLNANSKHSTVSLFPAQEVRFKWRSSTGGTTDRTKNGFNFPPYWIKLERIGNTLTGYQSSDGSNWSQLTGSRNITMTNNVFIGLAVSAGNNSQLCQVIYDNVTVTGGAPPPSPPTAPSNLAATPVSSSQIDLTWTDNSNDEDGFKIERKQGAGAFSEIATVGVGVQSFNNTGLSASTAYTYRVFSYNSAGNSTTPSNEFSATTNSGGGGGTWTVAGNGNDIYYTDGNVGIGTEVPDEALTVKGKIHTEEIIVNLSVPMADYVFEKDYRLMPLNELEQFVKPKNICRGSLRLKLLRRTG